MRKKILAVLLSLAMLGLVADIPVFAENGEAETVEVMEIQSQKIVMQPVQ